jgi:hypothetical protein
MPFGWEKIKERRKADMGLYYLVKVFSSNPYRKRIASMMYVGVRMFGWLYWYTKDDEEDDDEGPTESGCCLLCFA